MPIVCALQEQEEKLGSLIRYLQAMQGQRLWAWEEAHLTCTRIPSAAELHTFVWSLVSCG